MCAEREDGRALEHFSIWKGGHRYIRKGELHGSPSELGGKPRESFSQSMKIKLFEGEMVMNRYSSCSQDALRLDKRRTVQQEKFYKVREKKVVWHLSSSVNFVYSVESGQKNVSHKM